jgi:hypothetical protein
LACEPAQRDAKRDAARVSGSVAGDGAGCPVNNGLAFGGIAGVTAYMLLFALVGWWAFAFTPLVLALMVLVITATDTR